MLTSITPLGERGRRARWGVTVAWYLIGSVLAGAGLGALAGLSGQLGAGVIHAAGLHPPPGVGLALLSLAAAAGAGADTAVRGRALPGPRRQVDEDWLTRYRGWVYGGGFGVQLGVGVSTIVTSASVYVTWAAAALSASPGAGAVIGVVFGLARGLPVLGMRRVQSAATLAAVHRRLAAAEPAARRATVAALGLVAAVGTTAAAALLTSSAGGT